jgi:hypothetical protein
MRERQVTKTNYAQGGTVVHVDPVDEQALSIGGYLTGVAR